MLPLAQVQVLECSVCVRAVRFDLEPCKVISGVNAVGGSSWSLCCRTTLGQAERADVGLLVQICFPCHTRVSVSHGSFSFQHSSGPFFRRFPSVGESFALIECAVSGGAG